MSGSFNLVGVDARGHGRTEWTEQGELQVEVCPFSMFFLIVIGTGLMSYGVTRKLQIR